MSTDVARIRELETVRAFIMGSSLTVSIDAVFTVVFFAVMYFYCAALFWIVFATMPCFAAQSYFVTLLLRKLTLLATSTIPCCSTRGVGCSGGLAIVVASDVGECCQR